MLRGAGGARARVAQRALAGLLLALSLGAAAPSRAAASAPDGFFGINTQAVFSLSPAQVNTHLSAMSSGGLQVARHDAPWIGIEPNPPSGGQHTYSWSWTDSMVTSMATHGLRWYPTLDYSTTWSGQIAGDYMSAPEGTANYAAFAAALAKRYGRGGSFWQAHPELPQLPATSYEIWNEENVSHFWHPQASAPEEYADLYMAARSAIRGVDPSAQVVVGGLALGQPSVINESEFIHRMYSHRPDLVGHVDGVGFHPYAPTLGDVYFRTRLFRETLDAVGAADVPISMTEIGWTTWNTTDSFRAAALSMLAQDLPRSDCKIDRLIPHTWITSEADASDPEDWYGIMNRDATPKPSGTAYMDAVKTMRGQAAPTTTVPICYGSDPSVAAASAASPSAAATVAAAAAKAGGPHLALRIRRSQRSPGRLLAIATCLDGCRLRLDLVEARAATHRRLASRTLGFGSQTRQVRLTVPRRFLRRGLRAAAVRAVATGRSGSSTTRTRTVSLS